MGHFQDVDADVDERAAALQILAAEHAPVGDAAPAQRLDAAEQDAAELPRVEGLAHELRARVEAVLEGDHQFAIRVPCCGQHPFPGGGGVRQRLLAEDVAAGPQRVDGGLLVEPVGRADGDGAEIFLGQHLVPIGVRGGDAEALLVALHGRLGDVRHGDHLDVVAQGEFAHMRSGDAPGADEAVAQLLAHVFSLFPPFRR